MSERYTRLERIELAPRCDVSNSDIIAKLVPTLHRQKAGKSHYRTAELSNSYEGSFKRASTGGALGRGAGVDAGVWQPNVR